MLQKEILRFATVHIQTIWAPIATTLLFLMVFALALGGEGKQIVGVAYMSFLAPGLIMMSMAQNAFANTSSSLIISKIQGNIVDVLMPPLSSLELTAAYALGGMVRGLALGIASVPIVALFVPFGLHDIFYVLYHAMLGSLLMALLGLVAGIISDKFDHLAAVTSFIVMPATFLSGTFFVAEQLPPQWQFICHLNPFFYMVDGFRYGFIGVSDGTLTTGLIVMAVICIILFALCWRMIATGYRLRP